MVLYTLPENTPRSRSPTRFYFDGHLLLLLSTDMFVYPSLLWHR